MSTRDKVESILEKETAMSFTKLKKESKLENGTLSYHVEKSDKIRKKKEAIVHKDSCKNCSLSACCQNKCIYKVLENPTTEQVLSMKSIGEPNSKIAEEIGIHRSTVSYHVAKLSENGLLNEEATKILKDEGFV